MERYLPTGNEMISLPKLNEQTAAIEDLTFLSMQQRGMIELCGTENVPLMQPFIQIDQEELALTGLQWSREHFWIPSGHKETEQATVKFTVLTPVGERGFAMRLSVTARTDCRLKLGARGLWSKSVHCVNEDKELTGQAYIYESAWNSSFIMDYRVGFPAFALAPMSDHAGKSEWTQTEDGISYQISCELNAKAGQEEAFTIFWGLGFEEVAAATSAKEQLRRGWNWLYRKTADWLDKRTMQLPTTELTEVYNVNQFFCLFYATGRTFDTEELICATSRSTRYYVSAAYWDRDSLLWAFPTILRADAALAKEVLTYVFTRQRQNIGVHSRFIDGTMLEPGFELDELVAPVLALQAYLSETHDEAFLQERFVQNGLSLILARLREARHPDTALYETFLQPTDDEIVHPYLTYDNVLVWRALQLLADWRPAQRGSLLAEADAVRAAIFTHCVKRMQTDSRIFAWSVDLAGHHDVYDEPPGSLQLLPYYGFCERTDVIWQNTVRMIRSADYKFSFAGKPIAEIGCPHAPWPWVLSLCSSLLCGHAEQALRELTIMPMDNGIACESVDADTGECTTGSAFATCAGFLCHTLLTACKEGVIMRDDLKLLPWEICSEAAGWNDDFLESVFFLGNGRMGVRGYLPFEPDSRPTQQGLFVAGIFGEIKDGITDFVNLPSPVCETLLLNGTTAVLASPIHRTLDLKSASFYADFTLAAGDTRADVRYTRFFPKELPALLMQRFEIRVQNDVEVEMRSGINFQAATAQSPDDQVKENTELVQLAPLQFVTDNGNLFSCTFETVGTGLRIEQEVRFYAPDFTQGIVQNSGAEVTCPLTAHAVAGQTLVLEKLVRIRTSRDADERIAAAPGDWSFHALWGAHTAAWSHTWQNCDRTLPNEELQIGLRYSMFQLMASCAAHDPTVSIGARGLTHARYKGCYFWDTDLFMLPFFLKNDKTAAKNLCLYRANALDAARDHAKDERCRSAVSLMAALGGSEQCETWDIGCSEVHITADVAYALGEYCRETGDEEFYLHKAAPVFIETARFWVSRYTWNRAHTQADLMFCKGPDEYCGITRNNLFTNVMVQHNLALAIDAAKALQGKSAYQNLGLSEEETASWQTLHDAIIWPHDPDSGHLAQDETFHLLEPVDIAALKPDLGASYHHVCFDRLQRYKVVKQADVLLLMTRLPELFTKEEKMQAWNDFEPLCLHDSTLSFASHALFALQNGLREKGIEYLRKALLLDLRDLMHNTGKEGLHLAGMGESWQAACLL